MKKIFIYSIITYLPLSCVISCTQFDGIEGDKSTIKSRSEENSLKEYYDEVSSIPSKSIFSMLDKNFSNSRARDFDNIAYPTLTRANLDHLSSLTCEEFHSLKDSVFIVLGEERIEYLDSLVNENIRDVYRTLETNEAVDQLIAFACQYVEMVEGWNSICSIIPRNLSRPQTDVFINMAVYIDHIGRPLFDELTSSDRQGNYEFTTRAICKQNLAVRLAILGVSFSARRLLT